MNIVFMGTPDFAVASLQALIRSTHRVVAVVTAPDEPRGRGRKISPTPVKRRALDAGIPVLQPHNLRDAAFVDALRGFDADVFAVVAFRILPKEVFTLPRLGSFNLHASLLPKYRGAAPINWALINGDSESGVTTFFLKEKVDTGTLILQERLPVPPEMIAGELHDALMELGAAVLLRTVENCSIDWNGSAAAIHNLVRGLSPHPGAWTKHGDRILKVYRTAVSENNGAHGDAGAVRVRDERLFVDCGDGCIELLEIKQEGKRAMSAAEFLRGNSFVASARLG